MPTGPLDGRARNAVLNEKDLERIRHQRETFHRRLRQLGTDPLPLGATDTAYALADIHLQLCPPSLEEYPRSDQPKDLRYTGGLPRRETASGASAELPSWWDDVAVNPRRKRIVAVSQGTIAIMPSLLITPTMEGLADLDDVLVVVGLGKNGAVLPPDVVVQASARVADWIPFDEPLSYYDVFVSNGGYGSFQNAVARGVPVVVARLRWPGVGIDLGVGNTMPETVIAAVEEIFGEKRYLERVLEIKKKIETFDPMAVIVHAIADLAART